MHDKLKKQYILSSWASKLHCSSKLITVQK